MKLQIALKFLMLMVMLIAFSLVSYSSDAVTNRCTSSASSSHLTEMKTEGIELAAGGFEVGQMQA